MPNEQVNPVQLMEVLGSINNLAIKVEHLAETVEKSQADTVKRVDKLESKMDKHDERLRAIESQMPLIADMREHSRDAKRAIYCAIGTILVVAIIGGIMFAKTGGA